MKKGLLRIVSFVMMLAMVLTSVVIPNAEAKAAATDKETEIVLILSEETDATVLLDFDNNGNAAALAPQGAEDTTSLTWGRTMYTFTQDPENPLVYRMTVKGTVEDGEWANIQFVLAKNGNGQGYKYYPQDDKPTWNNNDTLYFQLDLTNTTWPVITPSTTDPFAATADDVMAVIDAIGTVVLSDDCKAKIDAAKNAYTNYSGDSADITNYSVLEEAIATWDELMEAGAGEIIVHIQDNSTWGEVAVYSYNGSNTQDFGVWPGTLATADADHEGWLTVSTTLSEPSHVILNNNGGGVQMTDFKYTVAGEYWIIMDDSVANLYVAAPEGWDVEEESSSVEEPSEEDPSEEEPSEEEPSEAEPVPGESQDNPLWIYGLGTTVEVEAGKTIYVAYQAMDATIYTLVVEGTTGFTVQNVITGESANDTDGEASVSVQGVAGTRGVIYYAITNNTEETQTYEATMLAPVGTEGNPDALPIGEAVTATTPEYAPYFYAWTAEEDGILTIVMDTENSPAGWAYSFGCSDGTALYFDYTEDASHATITQEVVAGDVINFWVASGDWSANTVVFETSFVATETLEWDDLGFNGWWTLHSAGLEILEGFKYVISFDAIYDPTENVNAETGETNVQQAWNCPSYVVFTNSAAEVNNDSADYSEYLVCRADNYAWTYAGNSFAGTLGEGYAFETLAVPESDDWVATYKESLAAGTTATITAELVDGVLVVIYDIAGVTSKATIPVDTELPLYLSLAGEHTNVTNITCTVPVKELTPAEIVAAAYALESGETLEGTYTLTGVITEINTAYSSSYGNISVTIQVGDMVDYPILCFRLTGEGADKLAVGDEITVTGSFTNYNGTIEFAQGCTLDSWVDNTEDAPELTPAEIVDAAYALESGEALDKEYSLTGIITKINSPYSAQYGNITITMQIGDMEDKLIQCYRLTGEGADQLAVGDEVTVAGILSNYNGKVQFRQGCVITAWVDNTEDVPALTTPEEIVNAAYALAEGEALDREYELTGIVTEITDPYNAEYGNITLVIVVGDMDDKPLTCYRLKGTGADVVAVGDEITVNGTIKNYGGLIEYTACTITAFTDNTPDEPSTDEPSTDEPSTDEPSTDEPSTDEPSTDEPSTDEPSTDEPSTDEPAVKTGWEKVDGIWYYYNEEGTAVTGWNKIAGKWYFFNGEGAMQTGWLKDAGKWYYLKADGDMATGWAKVGTKWYNFGTDGIMKTGWLKDGSAWYYLKADGDMATSWAKVGTKWYNFGTDGIMKTGWLKDGNAWYYLNADGDMATSWKSVNGKWYNFGTDGIMKTGWLKDAGKWYYLNTDGDMATGWKQIGGTWYYFNAGGDMVTGWKTINGTKYYFNADGAWVE